MNEQTKDKLSVIDSLSVGFRMVSRRPWLIIPPVLLDLLLWFGPRLSIQPLVNRFQSLLQTEPGAPEEIQQMAGLSRQMLEQIGEHWNLLNLLAHGVVSLPSFVANQLTTIPTGQAPVSVAVASFTTALVWVLLLSLAGTLLGGLYLTLIAGQWLWLRSEETDQEDEATAGGGFLHRLGLTWLRLILLALLILGAALLIIVPLSLLGSLISLVNPGLALSSMGLLISVASSIVIWIFFILYFVTDAIVLDGVGVLQAIWRSVNIVWRNLWPALGLAVLSYVIGTGFAFIWDMIGSTAWGTVAGILGTAYIGTALLAAGLAFYANRRQRWQEASAPRAT